MPISKINTSGIADNAVISSKIAQDIVLAEDIANNAITVNELANNAVTTDKILDGTIVTADLANDCVTIDKLANNSVGTDQIVDNSITLGTHTTGNYMSNVTAGSGISITHTQGEGSDATISLSGGTLVSNDSVTLGTHTTGEYIYRINTTTGTNAIRVYQYGGGPILQNTNSEAFNAELRLSSSENIFTGQMMKAGQFVEMHTFVGSYVSGTNDFYLDISSANSFKVTLSQDSDILFANVPTGLSDTQVWTLTIQQGSSNYSVVYPTNVHWPNGQKPTLSSASGAIDQFVFLKTGSTGSGGAIYGFTVGQDIKAPASP
tara:strand:- start:4212 stop:5168 length:957 start_codon:yes stop_codon:yes gene_type:complete